MFEDKYQFVGVSKASLPGPNARVPTKTIHHCTISVLSLIYKKMKDRFLLESRANEKKDEEKAVILALSFKPYLIQESEFMPINE